MKVSVDSSNVNELQSLSEVLSRDSLANQRIKNVVDPVHAQDAATKAYVDEFASVQSPGNYGTVVNPVTGKVWLDRNLGATQVATSSTDAASYGDLYQWGRGADGHQDRTSSTQGTHATTWLADEGSNSWDGKFIIGFSNWLSTGQTHMWSGTAAENNPCPSGYRIPTNAEWNQERLTWSSNNTAGAFASALKLPLAGYRFDSVGSLSSVGTDGLYWSSTVSGAIARSFSFNSGGARMSTSSRAFGFSVRCIKD